jgi:MYXO-CTERM domain-containing protein
VALGVAAGLVMLVAAHAHADWRTNVPLGTPGTPDRYVEVWSPRNFAVGIPNGAVLFLDGGYSRKIAHTGQFSAGALYANDCFISITSGGVAGGVLANGDPCLMFQVVIEPAENASLMRVRQVGDGGLVTVTGEVTTAEAYFAPSGTFSFTPLFATEGKYNGSLGVVRMGDSFYAAAGLQQSGEELHWLTNRAGGLDWGHNEINLDSGMVQAVEMFSPDGVTPYAVVGTQTGFLHSTLEGIPPSPSVSPGQWFDAGIGVPSLSLNVEAGGVHGRGFGMAITSLPDGGQAMASAVPLRDARQAGTRWVFRPLPADFTGASLRHVSCVEASYCVVAAERADAGTLFIYSNTAGPTLSTAASIPDGSVTLDEGQRQQLTFSATDPDQDPVLVSASTSIGLPGSWSLEQVDAGVDGGWLPGDPLVVTLSGGSVCADGRVGSLDVHASDGRASHDTTRSFPVYVRHTRPPQVPSVSRSKLQLVAGEADPLRFEVGAPVGGCALTGFQWSQVSGPVGLQAPTLAQQGSTAVLTAPPNLCVEGGALFSYQLVVNDDAGLVSQPARFDVRVAPWGRPRPSFVNTAPVVLAAGQSRVLSPEQSIHACADAAGFPGVETTWLLEGTLVEGITVHDVDSGTVVSQFPVSTGAAGLRVETRECLATRTPLKFTAVNRTASAGGLSSEPSSREVVVEATQLTPLEQGLLGLQRESLSPEGVLTVRLETDLNCLELRPELFAELQVGRVGGSESTPPERVRVPSNWNVNLDPSCRGGRFRVTGALVGGTGTSPAASPLEVDLPLVPPGLADLPPTTLVAACGKGASTSLTQTFPAGTCQTPTVTWTQMSGPPLAQASQTGNSVELATRDTGLDTLVGQSVVVKVTASVGGGKEVSREHSLPITVEPFVRVRRRTEVPAASETGLVGISVELRNTSACGVSGVSYVERLAGLTYVEGSAQFDGQPVAATWADGALSVTGLGLGAEGSGRLTYVARPHLVGERRMEGEARLNGELISIREATGPSVPVSGCGCTSSGSGPVLLALGALGMALRRRRR